MADKLLLTKEQAKAVVDIADRFRALNPDGHAECFVATESMRIDLFRAPHNVLIWTYSSRDQRGPTGMEQYLTMMDFIAAYKLAE